MPGIAPPTGKARRSGPMRLAAAGVCAVQALVLLGFCGFYLWELAQGGSGDPGRVIVSVVLIAIFATGLGYLARAWWQGKSFPSTPTVLWNVLLLPVAWGLFQSGRPGIGAALVIVALAGILSAVGSRAETP